MSTIYLCCKKEPSSSMGKAGGCPGGDVGAARAIRYKDGAITMALMPNGGPAVPANIIVRVLRPEDSPYCGLGDPALQCGRAAIFSGAGVLTLEDDYCIRCLNPDHCHWRATAITHTGGHGDERRTLAILSVPTGRGGDADSAAVLPGAGALRTALLHAPKCVPGDFLEPQWSMWDGEAQHIVRGQGAHMQTPCFCGGRVQAVLGEYGEEDILYRVGLQGAPGRYLQTVELPPSDFVEYRVGDWVFVARPSAECQACDSIAENDPTAITLNTPPPTVIEPPEGEEDPPPRELSGSSLGDLSGGVILPLQCGNVKAEGPEFEPFQPPSMAAHDMADVLDLCLRNGAIIEIDTRQEASVEVEGWGRFDAVPVHYHCPEASDTAQGYSAFREDDEVLVLASRSAREVHAIIGFADYVPRPCKEYLVLGCGFTGNGGAMRYTVWDVRAGMLAEDIPDGPGTYISPGEWPVTQFRLEYWLNKSRAVDLMDEMPDQREAGEYVGDLDAWEWDDFEPSINRFGVGDWDPVELKLDDHGASRCPALVDKDGQQIPPSQVIDTHFGEYCGSAQRQRSDALGWTHPHVDTFLPQNTAEESLVVTMERQPIGAGTPYETEAMNAYKHQTWRTHQPYINSNRQGGLNNPPASIVLTWGPSATNPGAGVYHDVIQSSRVYTADRKTYYNELPLGSFPTANGLDLTETTETQITFPGQSVAQTYFETATVKRPLVDEENPANPYHANKNWAINYKFGVTNAAGARSEKSWFFAHMVVTRGIQIIDNYADPPVESRDGHVDVLVHAGVGLVEENGLDENPFELPGFAPFGDAVRTLAEQAAGGADFWTADDPLFGEYVLNYEFRR